MAIRRSNPPKWKGTFERKIIEHSAISGRYRELEYDLRNKIIKEVMKYIKNSSLDENEKKKLTPMNNIVSRIHGLPKTHKWGMPIRPIINTIGSPTFFTKTSHKEVAYLSRHNHSFIIGSTHMFNEMKYLKEK